MVSKLVGVISPPAMSGYGRVFVLSPSNHPPPPSPNVQVDGVLNGYIFPTSQLLLGSHEAQVPLMLASPNFRA